MPGLYLPNNNSEEQKKLTGIDRQCQKGNPGKHQSRITTIPQINEDYITQVSEKTEGRMTKKQYQEFNRTKNRILSSLSQLDASLLNPKVRAQSGTVLGTSRNFSTENQESNEDRSRLDPRPEEVRTFIYQSPQSTNVNLEEASYNWISLLNRNEKYSKFEWPMVSFLRRHAKIFEVSKKYTSPIINNICC